MVLEESGSGERFEHDRGKKLIESNAYLGLILSQVIRFVIF